MAHASFHESWPDPRSTRFLRRPSTSQGTWALRLVAGGLAIVLPVATFIALTGIRAVVGG